MFQHLFMFVSGKDLVLAFTRRSVAALVDEPMGMSACLKAPPLTAFHASSADLFTTMCISVSEKMLNLYYVLGRAVSGNTAGGKREESGQKAGGKREKILSGPLNIFRCLSGLIWPLEIFSSIMCVKSTKTNMVIKLQNLMLFQK